MKRHGYEIRVRGELTYALANALTAMDWTIDTDDGTTVIGGLVRDQAELSGVLEALSNISLELLDIRQLDRHGDAL